MIGWSGWWTFWMVLGHLLFWLGVEIWSPTAPLLVCWWLLLRGSVLIVWTGYLWSSECQLYSIGGFSCGLVFDAWYGCWILSVPFHGLQLLGAVCTCWSWMVGWWGRGWVYCGVLLESQRSVWGPAPGRLRGRQCWSRYCFGFPQLTQSQTSSRYPGGWESLEIATHPNDGGSIGDDQEPVSRRPCALLKLDFLSLAD